MTKYEFIQEHDYILNEIWYFTKQDGLCMSGSMSTDKETAYSFFSKATSCAPKNSEEVIEAIYMITK